ncbi:Holliday junction resolvase RecU [Acetobacterium sp.]|uniref:Holliday junction resolvase RecU n=1 Tax=Acetobacterium sp. TaxID=1872094 RepID=UPI002F427C69
MTKTMYNEAMYTEKYLDPTAGTAANNVDRERETRNKMQGYRSRCIGKSFETIIEQACSAYAIKGFALIEKTPEPIRVLSSLKKGRFTACFEKKAQPDFKGIICNGTMVCFEAKATEKDRILKNRVSDVQGDYLERLRRMGAVVFILVSFNLENCYRVPWEIWRDMELHLEHKFIKEDEMLDLYDTEKLKWKNGYLDFLSNMEVF